MTVRIPIAVVETAGIERCHDTVTFGVPLSRAQAHSLEQLSLVDDAERALPWQGEVLARWPDRSIKWLLASVQLSVTATSRRALFLVQSESGHSIAPTAVQAVDSLTIERIDHGVVVHCGRRRFTCISGGDSLLSQVQIDYQPVLGARGVALRLRSAENQTCRAEVQQVRIGSQGPLRAEVILEGRFDGGGDCPLQFQATLDFHAGSEIVACELRVRNPRPARHVGGVWDLGDPGSWEIGDLSITVDPAYPVLRVDWNTERDEGASDEVAAQCTIYQDSSGEEFWNSPNHVDRTGNTGVSFQGFEVRRVIASNESVLVRGLQARPVMRIAGASVVIGFAVPNFWQEFPKALRWDGQSMSAGLFPAEYRGHLELQGGEQKRHRILLEFGRPDAATRLWAAFTPLHASVQSAWIERTGAVPGFVVDLRMSPGREQLVQQIVDGPHSFFAGRKKIDEFGWRHYGEVNADHEAVRSCGTEPFISHYNNQYDFVLGAAVHALRTEDPRWWQLMTDCARHTVDIDIYHTQGDRVAYNGGMFWHTDHYQPAATATHRSYSRLNKGSGDYGGGPSCEHNYASGLLLHHYLTGDRESAEAVAGLADWVIAMDDGARTVLGLFDAGPTGLASRTVHDHYHGPGRGAGNSISTLLDAHQLTGGHRYLEATEALIRRCIHPLDDIAANQLDQPEIRWSYLVFLQVIGKYLDHKHELGEIDFHFQYARHSLLHYANWMFNHEVPYLDAMERVLIPTETWPAQDIRKVHVFHLAARYAGAKRESEFRERAEYFHERCVSDLMTFATRTLARPLILLCVFGHLHDYHLRRFGPGWGLYGDHKSEMPPESFGEPSNFKPQPARVRSVVRTRLRSALSDARRRLASRRWTLGLLRESDG